MTITNDKLFEIVGNHLKLKYGINRIPSMTAVRDELAKVKGLISHNGEWGVILYNIELILDVWIQQHAHWWKDEERKSLHVYKETLKEVLVMTLRNFSDEYQRGGEPAVKDALELVFSKPMKEKNSKITQILKNMRLVMTLVRDLLPMGPHYHQCCEFSVGWLAKSISVTMGMYTIYMSTSMDVFRCLASKDEFPTYKEIADLVAGSVSDDTAGQHTLRSLVVLHDMIVNSTPGNPTIFIPYITNIEEVASKNFHSYKGTLGIWELDYISSLRQYREDVHTALYNGWFFHNMRSKEDLPWLDKVLVRTWVWLTPILQVRIPMPLMTGMVMDKVHKELEAIKGKY
ncbi:hypothetical protein EV702DRAFT_1046301 [Suillus placidus]|uniref:Uncharacterized protein n=1 Tax=Suillus placidus TaxID=48579 RepID=A0A9P7D203_9AGAM|nr:hypothetical protein EV702DRAFT_1046301 [Suillus placidus]